MALVLRVSAADDPAWVCRVEESASRSLVVSSGGMGPSGPKGDPGPAGAGLQISGSVASYSGLPAGLGVGDAGKGWLVGDKLYVWDGVRFPADGAGLEFRGPAGPAGRDGAPGVAGPAGPAGRDGAAGPAGPAGPAGAGLTIAGELASYALLPSGLTAADAGKAWLVGDRLYVWTGSSFPADGAGTEFRGPKGDPGPAGPAGPAGRDGSDGADGANGVDGADGRDGAPGPAGPAGAGLQLAGTVASYALLPSGLTAADAGKGWLVGDKLYVWSGSAFPADGSGTDFRGPKGDPGPAGPAGPAGSDGADGANGVDGADGHDGPAGPAGPAGPQGVQGLKGDPGVSLRVEATVATYADLPAAATAGEAHLVAADGKLYIWDGTKFPADGSGVAFQGPQGVQGLQGVKGDPGAAGAAGAKGDPGAAGAKGDKGDPGGAADVADVTHNAVEKTALVDADEFPVIDSAATTPFVLSRVTWANLKAAIAGWYNAATAALTNKDLSDASNTFPASLVTTTGAQSLSNKTLVNPTITGSSFVSGSVNGTATGLTLWTGTKAQFDAITTKDSNTVYAVTA